MGQNFHRSTRSFQKSAALGLLIVTTLLSHSHGSDLDVCNDTRSDLLDIFALVYGSYTLITTFALQNLGSDDDKCLSIKDGDTEELSSCNSTDPTQRMTTTVKWVNGWFFVLPGTTETLAIQGDYENALVKQIPQNGWYDQQWNFNYASDTLFEIINTESQKCLTGYPNKLTITTCGNLTNIDSIPKNQLWKKLPVSKIIGQLKNKLLNKCVHGENQTTGSDLFAKVNLQQCSSNDPGQAIEIQWTFDNTNEQAITFSTGKLLSVVGAFESNAPVEQMTAFVYTNQMWYAGAPLSDTDGDWVRLRNLMTFLGNPDYCLAATADGSSLEMQECGDADLVAKAQQFWKFTQNS